MNLRPGNTGLTIEHDLKKTALAQVTLVYKGRHCPPGMQHVEMECEIYEAAGVLSVHAACPRCRHSIWIKGTDKKIEYDKSRGLFVEPFKCPWELSDDHQKFGLGLCNAQFEFAGRELRDA